MTVPAASRRSPTYTGNGVTTAFPFAFKVFAATDFVVRVISVGGAITTAVLNSDYTVTLNSDQTVSPGGSVNMLVAPASGVKLVVIGALPYDQPLSLPSGGNFNPVAIENELDREVMQIQQIADGLAAAITVPIGETVPALPAASARAGYVLAFDSNGNPIVTTPVSGAVGTLATDLASTGTPSKGAGQVGFSSVLAYAVGTIGDAVKSALNFLQAGVGALSRTVQSKLRDWVSVKDFGAVGDGVTDDTAALQAAALYARTNGRTLWWPAPSSFYKTTAPINMGSSSRWVGESGVSTVLRNVTGGGSAVITCDGTGGLGPYQIEHMRIGGIGSVGITVTGGGFAQYIAYLDMYNVHFEADLLTCVSGNLIFHRPKNCSYGYYQQSGVNANHQHYIITGGAGGLNANVNRFEGCRFLNSPAAFGSVINSGIICEFLMCDWEGNLRNLKTNNVSSLLLLNCYTERVAASNASGAFEFDNTLTRAVVKGGYFDGGNLVAGAAMFSIDAVSYAVVEDARIVLSASAHAYFNNSAVSNVPPTSGVHHFRNIRISGNASDAPAFLDAIIEDGSNTWTPVPTNVTVVNGTGGVTYTGRWTIRNRQVFFAIRIVVTGTATTATSAVSFFGPLSTVLTGFPNPQHNSVLSVAAEDGSSLGNGWIDAATGRFWLPTWTAKNANIVIAGSYLV